MDLTIIRILIDLIKTQNSNVMAILLAIMMYNTYRFSRFLYQEIKKLGGLRNEGIFIEIIEQ